MYFTFGGWKIFERQNRLIIKFFERCVQKICLLLNFWTGEALFLSRWSLKFQNRGNFRIFFQRKIRVNFDILPWLKPEDFGEKLKQRASSKPISLPLISWRNGQSWWAIVPPPDMSKSLGIDLVGLQKIDHEFLKVTSLVTFWSIFSTVFSNYFFKIHD
jgi:hypothetical protein